jgi:DNA-binding LytR/AlgR family response regulator
MINCFYTRIEGKFQRILFEEILYIVARKNYSEIFTSKGKIFIYVSIRKLEEILPENLFCRTHRSFIVALPYVTSFDHHFLQINELSLPISKQYFEGLLNRVLIFSGEADTKSQIQIGQMGVAEYVQKVKSKRK